MPKQSLLGERSRSTLAERCSRRSNSGVNARRWVSLAVAVAAGVAGLVLARNLLTSGRGAEAYHEAREGYVRDADCAKCHPTEVAQWQGSQHQQALQPVSEATVLADFNNTSITHHGITTTFSRRDGEWWVTTDGPDGAMQQYRVRFTFGVHPLQQYLCEFPDGKLQALQLCWNVNLKQWFHLYDDAVPAGDPVHWTTGRFNWNHSCADCHSTAIQKGWDESASRYHTTWAEPSVGCQACHGPGAGHVQWARALHTTTFAADDPKGWSAKPWSIAESQVMSCAPCHSRRTVVAEGWEAGADYHDHYQLQLLHDGLYHADGQILDEVYVAGSFLQSKKYHAGVRCTDCHDPHTAALKAQGNALCTQCHSPAPPAEFPSITPFAYDSPAHHHHADDTVGTRCVECHMPSKMYMQSDPRRDHSFKVPRPDLSVKLGTPFACQKCHADRDAEWAAARVAEWFPDSARRTTPHWAEVIASARQGEGGHALTQLIGDGAVPAIVRATAVDLQARQGGMTVHSALIQATQDPSPLVRAAAGRAVIQRAVVDSVTMLQTIGPLLRDPSRLVRTETARAAIGVDRAAWPAAAQADFRAAMQEWRDRQAVQLDQAGTHLNLGALAEALGDREGAMRSYERGVALDPAFLPIRFNLATLLNTLGRNDEALAHLREVVQREPANGEGYYSIGLLTAEMRRWPEAVAALREASTLLPQRARVHYNLGIALAQTGAAGAAAGALVRAHRLDAADGRTLDALIELAVLEKDWPVAERWIGRLETIPRAAAKATRWRTTITQLRNKR